MLLDADQGESIIIAEDVRIPIKFMATEDEYKLFTTKPSERLI